MSIVADLVDRLQRPRLTTSYADDLVLFPRRSAQLGIAILVVAYIAAPLVLPPFVLTILIFSAIYAVAALGLNVLVGYTGLVSLGHAFFMAIGAYTASYVGVRLGLPMPVWIILALAIGGLAGIVVGPAALRLRGPYLALLTVAVLFIGLHLWENWTAVTGGPSGVSGRPPSALGPLDFNKLAIAGMSFTREQSWFWLCWALALLVAYAVKNVIRSRPGRAMQATRDRYAAAAVVGIDVPRTKIAAFALSSALAALSGAMYFAYVGYVGPEMWNLELSVQMLAIVIIGGMGSIHGTLIGATIVSILPRLVSGISSLMPSIVQYGPPEALLNVMLYGLLLVSFLLFEPRGVAGMRQRLSDYLRKWPYSY